MTDQRSPHFEDGFAPTLDPGQLPDYGSLMAGPGRWFVMVDTTENELIGVLWTDDDDGLGLIATAASSPAHVTSAWEEIRKARREGVPARRLFDELLQGYHPDVYGEGELSDLLAAL